MIVLTPSIDANTLLNSFAWISKAERKQVVIEGSRFFHFSIQLKAGHIWHSDVQDCKVIRIWLERLECFLRGCVSVNLHTLKLKPSPENLNHVRLIVNQKYPQFLTDAFINKR
jgi:hypothetical protein